MREDQDPEMSEVLQLYAKHDMPVNDRPSLRDKTRLLERFEFMLEELVEFAYASCLTVQEVTGAMRAQINNYCMAPQSDVPLAADALVDLVVVAKGTAIEVGIHRVWRELWLDVQRANLAKERGVGKRGHAVDLIKPPGWVGPRTEEIIRRGTT